MRRHRSRISLQCAVILFLVATAMATGMMYLSDFVSTLRQRALVAAQVASDPELLIDARHLATPGGGFERILDPSTLTIEEAQEKGITDSEPVIGVMVNGHSLALLVSAVSGSGGHDPRFSKFGGAHLAVVYCDLLHCARAFVGRHRIPLEVLGLTSALNGPQGMSILFGEEEFRLDAPNLPLRRHGIREARTVITTWGDWRATHPITRLYNGVDIKDL